MAKTKSTARCGLNGNFHDTTTPVGDLARLGVRYLGDGEWELPAGAEIRHVGEDNWRLTLADRSEWRVWSEGRS